MNDVVAFVRAPLVGELCGGPARERLLEPWLDLLTARSRGEEMLVALGKGPRPDLAISQTEHERSRLSGRAEVSEGKAYLIHEERVRGRARLVALMLSAFDGWLLVIDARSFEPLTIRETPRWFPTVVEPWWRPWPSTERRDGILGDELPFPAWKTAGLTPVLAAEAEAIVEPAPRAGPIHMHVCTRGRKPKPKACSVCGKANAGLLCDYPTGKKTCDKPLCDACTHKAGKLDLCPAHAGMARDATSSTTPAQPSLFGPTPPAVPRAARPAIAPSATLDLFGPRGKV